MAGTIFRKLFKKNVKDSCNESYGDGKMSLFNVVQQSNNEDVIRALIKSGADVNRTDGYSRTPLFYAVQQSNNENVVRTLIKSGADVNRIDSYGQTALFYAIHRSKNENVVRALIESGVDVNKSNVDGITVLFYAVLESNQQNLVLALIESGADVNKTDVCGQTALCYAVQQSNNENIIRTIIESGADVNKIDLIGKTALFYAVKKSNNDTVVRALIESGADVNKTDSDGRSVLFYAVQQSNNREVVRVLIKSGVDVNITNNNGQTALFYAVQQTNNDIVVRALIESGAEVNKTDSDCKTALFYAVQQCSNENVVRALIESDADVNRYDSNRETALFYAVHHSYKENVVRELIESGVDVNKSNSDGITALFYAVLERNNRDVVLALIKSGANVNKIDVCGTNALFYAVQQSNNENVVRALIESGADVNKIDLNRKTALFYAVKQSKNENVVRVLIESGADVNKTDSDGKTALFYAVQQCNNENVVRALIKSGSDVRKTDSHSKTVLFYAVQQSNNENVVRALIESNADVNKTDSHCKTALFYAVQQSNNDNVVCALTESGTDVNKTDSDGKTALFYAVKQSKNENVVREMIESCADVNKTDNKGQTALFFAVQQSNNGNMVHVLVESGADVNKTDNDGQTALFYAVQQSNNDTVVRALIKSGADVNKIDSDGKTVLFSVVQQHNNENMVVAMIESGVDVNKTDSDGRTALFYALQQYCNQNVVCALVDACDTSSLNRRDRYGRTLLFYAWKCSVTFGFLLDKVESRYLHAKDNSNVSLFTFIIENIASSYSAPLMKDVIPEHLVLLKKRGVKVEEFTKATINLMFSKILFASVHEQAFSTYNVVLNLAILYRNHFTGKSDDIKKMDSIVTMLQQEFKYDKVAKALELLFELGADPNSADSQGNTALHYLTLLPSLGIREETVMEMCQQLERFGILLNVRNHKGQTPLLFCLAAHHGMRLWTDDADLLPAIKTVIKVCKFLAKQRFSVEETLESGESVFHLIIKLFQYVLKLDKRKGRKDVLFEVMELLRFFTVEVVKGSAVNKLDVDLNSPLHLFASLALTSSQDYNRRITTDHTFELFLKTILQYLLKCGAKLNARNENEETPLHLCQTWSAVKLLIDAGANPKVVDSSGRSSFIVAAKNKMFVKNPNYFYPDVSEDQKQFWKTAIEKGLDPWTVDRQDESVLSLLLKSESYVLANALVDVACEDKHSRSETIVVSLLNAICKDKSPPKVLVQDLLKSRKCPTSAITALRFCCRNLIEFGMSDEEAMYSTVHCEIAKLLLSYGTDPRNVDSSGESCLDIAETCPPLRDLLTKPMDINTISAVIPWVFVSKRHEKKLAKVARQQESEVVDSFWYHKENIGSGSFGHVFAGINENDGREVAIKRIETLRMNRPEDKREITNLTSLADCEQVVRYLGFYEKAGFSYVVLELMEGNLDDCVKLSFFRSKTTKLCKDLVMGVKFLHKQNILHRDLKPTNILFKTHPELCLKIADFGLSRRIDGIDRTTVYGTNVGTRCWMAPEALKLAQHSKSSDVFSCGLLLHYILSAQKHPFYPANCCSKSKSEITYETEANLINDKMEGWDKNSLSPEATHLVRNMLASEKNITKRPTAGEALDHPLFWSKGKKTDILTAVGNQPEFECPRSKRTLPLTIVETDLEKSFSVIVRYAKWDDPGFVHMPAIYTEMTQKRKSYDTKSAVELVRFIRNTHAHVSETKRPGTIRKLVLEDFVFLDYFPHLVIEVYKVVTTCGWAQTRDEVKYAMNK